MFKYLIALFILLFISLSGFSQENSEEKEVFEFVEESPVPEGGMQAFYTYLGKNIKYPNEASENNIQGTVYLELIIGNDGKPRNVKILKNVGGGCGEEAKRVVENMPAWVAGKHNGKPVSVRIKLPIKFVLASEPKITIYEFAEEMPTYPGGSDSLNAFFKREMVYPQLLRENNIQGIVYINFVVDTAGNATEAKIARDIGGGAGNEAVRPVKLTKWNAGKQNGKPVNVRISVPVKFTIEEDSPKKDKKRKRK